MTRIFIITFLAFAKAVFPQEITTQDEITMAYYLPSNVTYDPKIPTPEEVLGYIPGEWHASHDQIVNYMYVVAASSNRISIENRGSTYEGRPLLLLTISSPENLNRIEDIRTSHIKNTETTSKPTATDPVVVYQGFSIHGNEASGSNAGLLLAYHLAAAQGPEIEDVLKNTIILLDPSFNPDGLQRFAGWVNQHKNKNITADSYDREYDEVWPGGRTNHYWFDMNRDWLPVQLPESQARIASFHKWLPNVLTDHHEMGTNSTFFFQPGIPSRTHPLTPSLNQELTREIGNYHAAALNNIKSLYYTQESFDDFYYGKGSTFPDINGGIGILFEQASSRGHAQNSINGVLTFKFTIRNQFTAALSTLKACHEMREDLLDYQHDFYSNARKESTTSNDGIIVGDPSDRTKIKELAQLLLHHKIEIKALKNDVKRNGNHYTQKNTFLIPDDQKNSRLIKAMFEKRTQFKDSLFYDISAWTLPLAFNLNYEENVPMTIAGETITTTSYFDIEEQTLDANSYAFLISWKDYNAPALLHKLLYNNLRVKVAMQPFTLENKSYDYGTLLISNQNQSLNPEDLVALLNDLSQTYNIGINQVSTGLTTGIDLGSSQFNNIAIPKIALLVGEGISPYDAGEIWHLMDQRYDIEITKIDLNDINRKDLSKYTTIIAPSTYGSPENEVIDQLKEWTRSGGTLIGYRNSLKWMDSSKLLPVTFVKPEKIKADITFEQRSDFYGAQNIGGAIFNSHLDLSHPIAFGYSNSTLPLFRNTSIFVQPHEDGFRNPVKYTSDPLLSGYISTPNLEVIKNSVPFQHNNYGRGEVIGFTDNTQFRAFWFGTNKLLMNAVFFSKMM